MDAHEKLQACLKAGHDKLDEALKMNLDAALAQNCSSSRAAASPIPWRLFEPRSSGEDSDEDAHEGRDEHPDEEGSEGS